MLSNLANVGSKISLAVKMAVSELRDSKEMDQLVGSRG